VAETADTEDLTPKSIIPEKISEDEPSENVSIEEPVSETSPDLIEDGISDDINFFSDKFYEETNYAQEKLKQFLLAEFNKDKRFGRVVSVRLENLKVS